MPEFSWKATSAPDVSDSGRTDDIWFIDEKIGWAVNSNAQILFTADGGDTWSEQQRIRTTPPTYLRCVSFATPKRGWVGTLTSANRLFETSDGGKKWTEVRNLPPNPPAICGLCAVDATTIYASGTNFPNRPPGILKSTDGGTTWSFIDMQRYASLLVDIYFSTPDKGWVVGGVGGTTRDKCTPVVLATEDGGKNWKNQASTVGGLEKGEWGWKIQFLDANVGFVSLENFDKGAILKTKDGGKSWTRLPVSDPQKNANLEGIGFIDEKNGWVGGWGDRDFSSGFTSGTGDGGVSWQNANEVGRFINRFRFIGKPPRVAYASGATVYKYAEYPSVLVAARVQSSGHDAVVNRLQVVETTSEHLEALVAVAPNTPAIELDIWDRFGDYFGKVGSLSLPKQGTYRLDWNFKRPDGADAGNGPFIYRLTSGDDVHSGLISRGKGAASAAVATSNFRLLSEADKATPRVAFGLLNQQQARAPLPSIDEEKEAFFKIANIEDYPDFRERAKAIADAYLSNVNYSADPLYNQFPYTEETFDARMKAIYDAVLPGMYEPHDYDRDVFKWGNKKFRIGRASDDVVRDRILQMAPFNLMDGVWLQNIMQAGPSDAVQSRLFDIWADEVGNGETHENHSNVYLDLLRSQGIYLPSVTSKEFLDIDVAPGAWRAPVFQQSIGLFPQAYFPELIGMTLFLEWEATPTLMPIARMLEGRGMNPLFYSLHVAIDNISEGHGALAKEAVKIYLEEKREEGGERSVQEHWIRIWNGYVGWATAGFNGVGMLERRLILDKKRINLGGPDAPQCFPDFKKYYHDRMAALIRAKSFAASKVHGRAMLDGVLLNSLFDDPDRLMEKLVSSGMVNVTKPRHSRLFELMEFGGPMYRVFTDADIDIINDWLESLSEEATCVDPLPDVPDPGDWPQKMEQLILSLARRGKRAHDRLVLPKADGTAAPLVEFFDDPKEFMRALVRGGWVVPGAPDRSMFLQRVLENGGPMQGEIRETGVETVREWIRDGAKVSTAVVVGDGVTLSDISGVDVLSSGRDEALEQFRLRRPMIGQGAVH